MPSTLQNLRPRASLRRLRTAFSSSTLSSSASPSTSPTTMESTSPSMHPIMPSHALSSRLSAQSFDSGFSSLLAFSPSPAVSPSSPLSPSATTAGVVAATTTDPTTSSHRGRVIRAQKSMVEIEQEHERDHVRDGLVALVEPRPRSLSAAFGGIEEVFEGKI